MAQRVLVVEDDELMGELIGDVCSMEGLEPIVVKEGWKALQLAVYLQPEIITLDLDLPDISGLKVLELLRNRVETREIPVVVISVMAHEVDWSQWLCGPDAIFNKPFTFKQVYQKVKELVQNTSGTSSSTPAPVNGI